MQKIKFGVMAACLPMLPACSTNEPQINNLPLICPQITECRPLNVNIRTNGDLADSLNQALDRLEICAKAYTAVNKCITDFNNQNINQKEN
ncbi:Rz1-like lysis system protein LysC [Rodentibacter pneumotropicus]|uniref:Rz1-like lysis system protein LysC n=1 Tax=Rodentibacter pneumotropicus TaxID=758 RepID=UPI003B5281F9